MSIEAVAQFAEALPYRLREEVIGYARSVEQVLPEIYRDAAIATDPKLSGDLIFIAGVKKLYSVCSSTFWILDNSLASLSPRGVEDIRIGSTRISRGSREWSQIREVLDGLESLLVEHNIRELVDAASYADILRHLAHER